MQYLTPYQFVHLLNAQFYDTLNCALRGDPPKHYTKYIEYIQIIMSKLQLEIAMQSFWHPTTRSAILPADYLDRQYYVSQLLDLEDSNLVVSVMGQRRAGKSLITRQFLNERRKSGIPDKNTLYINFLIDSLSELSEARAFWDLVEWWHSDVADSNFPKYLVLDEVQELTDWDKHVASLFEDPKFSCKIFITGSNSKLLSEELSTNLGGRYITVRVFPFSFKEFCLYNALEYSLQNIEDYLETGGMPEVVKLKNEHQRAQLVNDIINSTVKYDIIRRYNPSNPQLLYSLIDFCRSSFSKELSVNSITNAVVNSGKKQNQTSSSLIEEYLGYMEDVYFLHLPRTYSYRSKDILSARVDKVYLGDLSMATFKRGTERGRLLENFVYLEITRRGIAARRFFGYRNKNLEIDFHFEKGDTALLLQVCWKLGDFTENKSLWEREFGNLEKTNVDALKYVLSLDEKIVSPVSSVQHMSVIEFLKFLDDNF